MIKKFMATLAIALSILGVGFGQAVYAQSSKDAVCAGVGLTGGTAGCTDPKGAPTVDSTLKTIVNLLSIIVGAVAVIMIIIAGFKFVTSGGSAEKVTGARNTIVYSIIGLVIVALAQVIVRFVINKTSP